MVFSFNPRTVTEPAGTPNQGSNTQTHALAHKHTTYKHTHTHTHTHTQSQIKLEEQIQVQLHAAHLLPPSHLQIWNDTRYVT